MDTTNNNGQSSTQQGDITTKVYYGEYTLKHWINLMCKGNIILPEYQRSFVWKEADITRLITSLSENQFIPPVTIAHDDRKQNIILDGQQRLTSILLAYIGYYPNAANASMRTIDSLYEDTSDQEEDDEEEQTQQSKHLDWTFENLLKYTQARTPEQVRDDLKSRETDYYKALGNLPIKNNDIEQFFESRTLGFSYIVPDATDQASIQSFYTKVFRNMNYYGKTLSPLESRRSLYYRNPAYSSLFDAKTSNDNWIFSTLRIEEKGQPMQIDFVRYLAILSQRACNQQILKGYSAQKNRENYCVDYISHCLKVEEIRSFDGFDLDTHIPSDTRKSRLDSLNEFIANTKNILAEKLNYKRTTTINLPSIIDADYYLFGAIYFLLFKEDNIPSSSYENLISEIGNAITSVKRDSNYTKSANTLSNIRSRVTASISIYQRHIQNTSTNEN